MASDTAPPPVPTPPPEAVLRSFRERPPDFLSPHRSYAEDEAAQQLVYDAWEVKDDPLEKFRLCQEALRIFPFSVDAYNCIGDIYRREWSALEKSEQAYRYALDCSLLLWPTLRDEEDIPWGVVVNRPHLRSRHGLGMALEAQGKTQAAVEQFRHLLKVCPSDNQGVRVLLFEVLLTAGEYKEAEKIAEKHSEGRQTQECYFAYGYVIIDFLKFKLGVGKAKQLKQTLCKALMLNNMVPLLLLADVDLGPPPETEARGSIDEATSYVRSAMKCWERTAGILDWLRSLRSRDGPKPNDDGSILFQLMQKGYVVVRLQDGEYKEVTTNVANIPGTGLADFKLPPGMKDHDSSRMVCYMSSNTIANSSYDDAAFTEFPYTSVQEVHFWSLLQRCSTFGDDEKPHACAICFKPANMRCSKCKIRWYCSTDCQRKDWKKQHKTMCPKYVKT